MRLGVSMRDDDIGHCAAAIRTGSHSFYAASKLLPGDVRDPVRILYAFCRLADDEVDEGQDKTKAVLSLGERLDRVYAGRPIDRPEDRAMASLVVDHEMPRVLPEALLEGLAWDAQERRYETIADLRDYAARVAAAVGVMMCVLMKSRNRDVLARACDLGVAMQLTNIARDVGEDARAGRIYLPISWCRESGIDPKSFLQNPVMGDEIAGIVKRLLAEADRLYRRSEAGIDALPFRGRMAIWSARLIYDGIGGCLKSHGYNSIDHRASTSTWRKLSWMGESVGRTMLGSVMPTAAILHAKPLDEVAFLVDAAERRKVGVRRSQAVMDVLMDLAERDRMRLSG